MKHSLFILLLVALSSCEGIGQTDLRGTVVDNYEGLPQEGIIVEIANRTTTTDSSGAFIIQNLEPGEHTLRLKRKTGELLVSRQIRFAENEPLSLSLEVPPFCPYNPNAQICPICKKKDQVVDILYGFPSEEMFEASDRGDIMLGGCEVSNCDPHHYCKRDKIEF